MSENNTEAPKRPKRLTAEKITAILDKHTQWVLGKRGGVRAVLTDADRWDWTESDRLPYRP